MFKSYDIGHCNVYIVDYAFITEEQCKKRWVTIRDRYVRLKRTHGMPLPSGSGADSVVVIK